MKFTLNVEKKHFYSILSLLIIFGSITFVYATYHNPGHVGDNIQVTFEEQTMSLNNAMAELSGSLGNIEYASASCWMGNTEITSCAQSGHCKCDVSCPAGKLAISGGAYLNAGDETNEVCGFAYSGPKSLGTGWKVGILPRSACGAPSSDGITLNVYVVCSD
jgi:hypothetical protein